MRMAGVEIPAALIDAHESDELVIFVGAGASIPWPSGLPGFRSLVDTICEESNLGSVIKVEDHRLDENLSEIQDRGVAVHKRVAELTDKPGSQPSPVHEAIVKLALAGTPRIVTTNYDRHLSTLLGTDVTKYMAPALPVGDDFSGIVYLHGSLDQNPRNLVATADDFGKAYLTDAWAARFLDRMFASHPVLFVGYSHTDTIMKYLARGLGGRSKKRFALAKDADPAFWGQLGITPIECSFTELPVSLEEWADKASYGLLGHREHVKALVENQDPSPTPDTVSYLESIFRGTDTIKFFTLYARGESWLRWAAERPEFTSLFYPAPQVDPVITRELAIWFAENYLADDQLADVAFELVADTSGSLGPDLLHEICRCLAGAAMPLPAHLRRWLPIVTRGSTNLYQVTLLEEVLRHCHSSGDTDAWLFLFEYLTEPQLALANSPFGSAVDVSLKGTDYFLGDLWENSLKPSLPTFSESLLTVVDRQLRRADLELALTDDTGRNRDRPSIYRAAIEAVSEDQYGSPLGLLIDIARDCLDSLLTAEVPEGYARVDAWAASEITLLRRLALHGWTQRHDKSAGEKIEWLLTTGWMQSLSLRHEMLHLATSAIGTADVSTADALVEELRLHADDDQYAPRRTYTWLTLIAQAAPALDSAKNALASLTEAHPELIEIPSGTEQQTQSAWTNPPPATATDLHNKLVGELAVTASALIAYEAESSRFDDRERWERLSRVISDTVQEWPEDGFGLLDAVGPGHPIVDRLVVRGWARSQPSTDRAARILQHIEALGARLNAILDEVTFMLAGFALPGTPASEWYKLNESKDLAKKCWDIIDPDTISGTPSNENLTTVAINHPAGHLALFWVSVLKHDWNATRDTWREIPTDFAEYLRQLLDTGGSRGEMVEVVFGQQLHFFYEADGEWCTQQLLPRFDWADPNRPRRVWDGYLSGGRWNNRLVAEGFVQKMLATLAHRQQFSEVNIRRLFIQLADISIYSDTDPRSWVRDLITDGTAQDRVEWAEALGYELGRLESSLAEREWRRWIADYWSDRTRSVPRDLDAAEASAMARWAVFFTDSMESAIDLALEVPTAGFGRRSLILRDLTNDRIDRAPDKLAKLIGHMLRSTEPEDGQPVLYASDLQRIYRRFFEQSVPNDVLRDIATHSMRLGVELS
jgi:hypothetical protein